MHAEGGFRPMLFDLKQDPQELIDLAKSDSHGEVINKLYEQLAAWVRRASQRVTKSEQDIKDMRGRSLRRGIVPFLADGTEVDSEPTQFYRGPVTQIFTDDTPKGKA